MIPIPLYRASRAKTLQSTRLAAVLIALWPSSDIRAEPSPASRTLTCEFTTAQTGQFKGLRYVGTPAANGIVLTLAASAADAEAGRAIMITGERAAVVELIVQRHQTLFVDSVTPDDTAFVSVFTAARDRSEIPATYWHQAIFGTVPIIAQYTGVCREQ